MKILITAGGGGHFSPALAVIKQLQKEHTVLFVGRKYVFEGDKTISFEYRTLKELEIPFRTITTGRLQRHFSFRTILSLCKIPVGFIQSLALMRSFAPDVVFSTGGYVAVPVTIAAWMLRIPVVVHEQTMHAGLANKIAGKFAAAICLSWVSSAVNFPKDRVVITGNPLREELLALSKSPVKTQQKRPMIFITGGSLGAHAINVLIEGIIEKLVTTYTVVHQTGDAQEYHDFSRLERVREKLPTNLKKNYQIMKFAAPEEMATLMQQASLVIARAGMNTVIELLYLRKPALLIPLPHGQKNEQRANATFLKTVGLARVKSQHDLTPETLYTEIEEMMAELSSYRLKGSMPSVIQENATEKIITAILSVTEKFRAKTEPKTE